MRKYIYAIIVILVIAILVGFYIKTPSAPSAPAEIATTTPPVATSSPLNATYLIDKKSVTLFDGSFEEATATDSASVMMVNIFGNPVYGDMNVASSTTALVFLSETTGGSGIFYYVAATTKVGDVWQEGNAVLLGDRIIPQTIVIDKAVATVTYLDRQPKESLATEPTVTTTKDFVITKGTLMAKKTK